MASVLLIVKATELESVSLGVSLLVVGVLLIIFFLVAMSGFILLEPNEARVLTFFGKYCGSFYETGFWWVNFLMSAKKILLLANGEAKAQALYDTIYGPITPQVPASVLQLHADVTLVADEAALSKVEL